MSGSTTETAAPAADPILSDPITVGVTGQRCRAAVTPWGDVTPFGGLREHDGRLVDGATSTLSWHVAAEDRWHVPSQETSIRQRRIDGTPVLETRMRIPDGDAVHRVWAAADSGGLTIVEVENDSPLPFAVAFSGIDVLTERPVADVPVQGIELPEDAIVMPVGHHATIRVAIPHDRTRVAAGRLPTAAPSDAVVRGWLNVVHRASRLVLPDEGLAEAVTAARCDLLLDGPVDVDVDTVGFLLDVAELGRLGDEAERWLPEIVEPVAAIARSNDAAVDRAFEACERLAVHAGDDRAAGDLARLRDRRARDGHTAAVPAASGASSFSDVRRESSAGRFVAAIEHRVADAGRLLPLGIPARWLGIDFEVHGVPTGARSAISFAVRWHGERPAVLWEQHGDVRRLTAPSIDDSWSTTDATGEALWAAPARAAKRTIELAVDGADAETTSFS